MFDAEEYAQAMDEFIIRMEKISSVDDPDIGKAMERLCRLLRIARIDALLYDNAIMEEEGKSDMKVAYMEEDADASRIFSVREVTGGGNIAVFRIYPKIGNSDWNETEYEKLQVLEKLLYSFNGRIRVMHIVENLTFHDQGLGTYNLNYFMKMLGMIIEQHTAQKYVAGYFNLKRFSVVNQRLGRKAGTRVMRLFIQGLQDKLTENEVVARVGGDNFVILFYEERMEDVKQYLTETYIVYDPDTKESIALSAYTGYYRIPETCNTPTDIMDCLSAAFHVAKSVLRTNCVFYDKQLIQAQNDGKLIESLFPEAIRKEEFLVYYQPKVLLKDYRLAGAEALCRWKHGEELIPPNRFIPVLEQGNAVCILDFYMLEHVCADIRRWIDEGRRVVKVSVNFSRRHMVDPDLVERILQIVDRYRVPHQYIEIELTETTTDVDFQDLKKVVSGLKDAGISTSVDDFGIGYSSINLIRESPWSVLKIDRSFLPSGDQSDPQKYVMLKYLIAMFQDMGLECIVEGVETVEQVKLLKENNCYLAQGFYFDKPLPVEEFEKKLLPDAAV